MKNKVDIQRLPTGVPGLDEVLGGGLPEYSFNLIAGMPGCGKTTLAHQIMFALASAERPALYLTVLGEPPLKMLRYQQQFEFFNGERVRSKHVTFVNLAEETLSGDLEQVLQRIVEEVEAHNPSLVFVDSFRSVVLSSVTHDNSHNLLQQFMQQLGMLMISWQATTFLIGEYLTETDANPVFTVADGLIWLRQSVMRNSMVRKMEVMKMRGQNTIPGLHSFRMSDAGIEVFPPTPLAVLELSDEDEDVDLARISLGIDHLDEMLGGGLPVGYSLLIAGPPGSGKTVMAAEFLAEGHRRGETGVVAAFEQRPGRARNPGLSKLIKAGKVTVIDNRGADISINEVITTLMREIRRTKATRVVIDSLSGLELHLAPTFREDFRESLLSLMTTLSAEGVSVLMTSELEDRYIDLRFSPYGTAFLTDAIIVQRYVEIGSHLRRLMAVVKVRASEHSNALREYTIDRHGIHIGETLPEFDGLLRGGPMKHATER